MNDDPRHNDARGMETLSLERALVAVRTRINNGFRDLRQSPDPVGALHDIADGFVPVTDGALANILAANLDMGRAPDSGQSLPHLYGDAYTVIRANVQHRLREEAERYYETLVRTEREGASA